MSTTSSHDISLVIPTYNRAEALRANLGVMLAMQGVGEVIVVNDGSSDDTVAACEECEDSRLRVISHPQNRGLPAGRNTGGTAARGTWVLFGEDDCRFPPDYGVILREEALSHNVDIVGAPVVELSGSDDDAAELASRAPRRNAEPRLDEVHMFPSAAIETPFIPAPALVRASIFDHLRYYEGFMINAYREETDFFIQATKAGYRCLLTPNTYCYQLSSWDGGCHTSTLRYEYATMRNNWRFLRRHGAWLVDHGDITDLTRSQLRFSAERIRQLIEGGARARAQAASNRLSSLFARG